MKSIKTRFISLYGLFLSFLFTSPYSFASKEHPISIDNQTNYTITVYSPPSWGRCTYKPGGNKPAITTVPPRKKGVFIWEDSDNISSCFFEEKFTSFKFITQDNKLLWTSRIGMIEQKDGYIDPSYFYGLFFEKQYCPVRLDELSPDSDEPAPPPFIKTTFNSKPIPTAPLYYMYNYRTSNMRESDSGWEIILTQPPKGTVLQDAGNPEFWTCYN
ncbi:hypothetical protein FE392_01050 [Xenorhabdus sp. 12]|uniref:Secreted protein n=1 Tax=Xenorhabdus santafensis TaxID=2582833 RepID=A0ABU4S6Z4_9GAMM|nr:hypothetical protein [Xenorhabdus sp. 12]MDX7985925.1 hypothetical protein [Xenorhabdus sp. 12]